MKKYNEMTTAELLGEKCYLEQLGFCAEVHLEIVKEEIEKRFTEQKNEKVEEIKEEKEAVQVKEIKEIVLNNKRKRSIGSKLGKNLKIGDIIVTDYNRYNTTVEKIETIDQTKHFIIVNGKRKIKKTTERSIFLGYC